MSKRGGVLDMKAMMQKKAKMDKKVAANAAAAGGGAASGGGRNNVYLSQPVQPEQALQQYLHQVRKVARNYLPKESRTFPVRTPYCEVEARLGVLKVPHAVPDRRICATGAKHVNGRLAKAFDCTRQEPKCQMASGVSRSHFLKWTGSGVSERSPLSAALGVTGGDSAELKAKLVENEYVETVYAGYPGERRVAYDGQHPNPTGEPAVGKMEYKEKLLSSDYSVPAAPYDVRISLASEKVVDHHVPNEPPSGWSVKRIKRRRSYTRRDKSIAWQIDVTEVTTTYRDTAKKADVDYEIEMELRASVMLELINEPSDEKAKGMCTQLANQIWWVLSQINPLHDALDVEECLRDHPDKRAVQIALAQCGAFRRFMETVKREGGGGAGGGDAVVQRYESAVGRSEPPPASWSNVKFVGCMPVNFSRHNLEEIQRSSDNAYFLSEKTDGVRHFLIFTGDTAVLVDRAMRGKQPIPADPKSKQDPFAPVLPLIKPGTVLDGEVVMNRRSGRKPRPIFIVFDVMATGITEPVLHLPFERRLRHLRQATFRTPAANRDMFDPKHVADPSVTLPLVRKNFVKRTDLDDLLQHVVEEKGMRCYRNGDSHNHLTDGIIFQPNAPYVCGTDRNLLKWKYLDTVTIDVELLPLRPQDDDDALRVGCLGEEQTNVDMTRYVLLPKSERMRLEADRLEDAASGGSGRIAEVGFDPETGEWYYLTMRGDKIAPNHISTVLGTMLELGESLTTDELRYRMSVPAGAKDSYRKDMRGMLKQLLDHQRKRNRQIKQQQQQARR